MTAKDAKSQTSRVETLTIRVSPKMKYGLELLARKHYRTLSSVAEWALDRALKDTDAGLWVSETQIPGEEETTRYLLDSVWDPDEIDRLINLSIEAPNLLTYEEQVLTKLIFNTPGLSRGTGMASGHIRGHERNNRILHMNRLREHWNTFKKVAAGELDASALPTWPEKQT